MQRLPLSYELREFDFDSPRLFLSLSELFFLFIPPPLLILLRKAAPIPSVVLPNPTQAPQVPHIECFESVVGEGIPERCAGLQDRAIQIVEGEERSGNVHERKVDGGEVGAWNGFWI